MAQPNDSVTRSDLLLILSALLILFALFHEWRLRRVVRALIAFLNFKFAGV